VQVEFEYDTCKDDVSGQSDFTCSWDVNKGSSYEVRLEDTVIDRDGNVNCAPNTTPEGVTIIGSEKSALSGGPQKIEVAFECDENIIFQDGDTNPKYCIRTDIFINDKFGETSVAYHKTIVDVNVRLDGSIAVSGISLEEDENFFEDVMFMKQYEVNAYQCAIEFPHVQSDYVVYPNNGRNKLGICIETTMTDNMIVGIDEFSLDMPPVGSSPGYSPNNNPRIKDDVIVWMSAYNCDLIKPGSTEPRSMCFIETMVESAFFDAYTGSGANPLLNLRARGDVDLRMRNTSRNLVKIDHKIGRALQAGFDGSYTINTRIATDVETRISSGANIISTMCRAIIMIAVVCQIF